MESLAPIVLFVYNRPWHTEKTLKALQDNYLANESILYIYCDGPKQDISDVGNININLVRNIVRMEQWCKEVHILESKKNLGLADSIKMGVTDILEQFEKVIVMEDDLVTSPFFLTFMNKALDYYRSRKSVFSISGHSMPHKMMQIPDDYPYEVYVSLRNDSWGWGTWTDRWNQIDWNAKVYNLINNDENLQEALNRGGDDIFEMLQLQLNGKLNIWSIYFTLAHFVNHAVAITPVHSYVNNIGLDGSGENCKCYPAMNNKVLNINPNFKFLDILYEDRRIINAFYSANLRKARPIWQKIINRLSRYLLGRNVFIIKKKVYN